ncbi:stage II sporulation protein P [Metabacillus halosaccharovorans]|uniref:stage II sporulation protein P n=1 Tax=Metabacillus halosaccharovorans TaxID=930124 RepID=UPI001C1F3AE9|nr:stage II sporulation protein P [Metabacillus halosaccharovorans]MBU7592789.1 hypothetical protein [Metabacillus halosaccharovorans]
MRIEDLFNNIKNSSEIKPRKEFIEYTKKNLLLEAKKYNKRQKVKKLSYLSSSFAATILMIIWISFFGGTQYIADSVNQVMASIKNNNENGPFTTDNSTVDTPYKTVSPSILIYHTHNTESFTDLLNIEDPHQALDNKKNITLVGQKLAESLENNNIQTLHDKSNIHQILKDRGLSFSNSYEVSRDIIREALDDNEDIKLIMDIHRGSESRSVTTTEINEKKLGRITFAVSELSSRFEENKKIAELFHNKLEEKYPGVSGGIILKGHEETESTYNQDMFDNSLLVMIGGPENTLEEEYRSVEILSKVIGDILKELE